MLPETVTSNIRAFTKIGTDSQTGAEYNTASDTPTYMKVKRTAPTPGKKGVTRTLISIDGPGEDILTSDLVPEKRVTVNITVAHPEGLAIAGINNVIATAAGILTGTATAVTLADFPQKAIGGHR